MDYETYDREGFQLYEEFAATVRQILEKAIEASDVPRPQSVQSRAKSPKSLGLRLDEINKRDASDIEAIRRDLSGVRLIFYTNSDVDRFLHQRILFDNFDVEQDSTKIHHPTEENSGTKYRGIHFTVALNGSRVLLPEYAKYAGLRCEIQIQTILNHAWSETSHGIYKETAREGFGSRAAKSIERRFARIMDDYLLPAGYEIQRVQHDYERLQQGKALFDRDLLSSIANAANNNERYDLIRSLREYVIPNYDDIGAVYIDVIAAIESAYRLSKGAKAEPIDTPYGQFDGKESKDVSIEVLEIIEGLRYIDVGKNFSLLCDLFQIETDHFLREKIVGIVRNIARYNLDVWKRVGPSVQLHLLREIEGMPDVDRIACSQLVTAATEAILDAGITGTSWNADSVTLRSGSIPLSVAVGEARDRALAVLFDLFDAVADDDGRRALILAMRESGRTPAQSEYSNELLRRTITDSTQVTEFLLTRVRSLSYEILEWLEDAYLYDYWRARALADDEEGKFGCAKDAQRLIDKILSFRDRINADASFVRYKMLVGFETVLPQHWKEQERDFEEIATYRNEKSQEYVDDISSNNESDWFSFIERCAATESNDLATFPTFGGFLRKLACQKPDVADRLLGVASVRLMRFLPAILSGLLEGGAKEIYQRRVEQYLRDGEYLGEIAFHFRRERPGRPLIIQTVLKKAMEKEDDGTVIQCLLFAMEAGPEDRIPKEKSFFTPAISYLNDRNDVRWVGGAIFPPGPLRFFAELSGENAELLLENMIQIQRIEFQAERVLIRICEKHLPLVWDFFGRRIELESSHQMPRGYDAVPHQFHGLEKHLSRDVDLAVSKVREFYSNGDKSLFRFRGGRLLSITFPEFSEDLSGQLGELVSIGSPEDADFVLAVMENYHGEPATHEVLKRIIAKYPNDRSRLTGVSISFDNTGVVYGAFGFVEAMRQKKAAMEFWLEDERPEVRSFAAQHIHDLEVRIADEQRRAEEEIALRRLEYDQGEDDDDDPDGGEDGPEEGNDGDDRDGGC